jgi:hypothetical protein
MMLGVRFGRLADGVDRLAGRNLVDYMTAGTEGPLWAEGDVGVASPWPLALTFGLITSGAR